MDKKFVLLILFISLLSVSFVSAVDLPSWKDKYVNDFAGVFNSSQVDELRSNLLGIEQGTSAEVVVVTDDECASKGGPGQYATELLSGWKVGKADKDNGFLVLYCKEENKIFAATGYGLEGILPDSKVGRLLDENYVPLRDEGNVQSGIINFVGAVSLVIEENKEEVLSGQAGGNDDFSFWSIFMFIIWIILLMRLFSGFKTVKCKRDGLKMKKIGRRGNHNLYQCPKGHIREVTIAAAASFLIWHVLARGFGGGGFGGGGFGGGMGGGGGAGR